MSSRFLILCAVAVTSLWGQRVTDRRSAELRGGGGDGKCTIEVVVDELAEVEIRGRNATIRTLRGSPASFRRFQCNFEMPNQPYEFRFQGIDGRGRQDLVRSPGNGGPAVIRIEDNRGGNEGYTFDIFWRGGGGGYSGGGGGGGFGNPGGGGGYGSPGGGGGGGGWNNGWGNGNGWITNGTFNYEGGRRGSGVYQDQRGDRRRLDNVRVVIGNGGNVGVAFDSDRGRIDFRGRVARRDGRVVYAEVSGNGMNGLMVFEMSAYNQIRRISMNDIRLSWSN